MKKSFKDIYLELTEKVGGPYSLITKGVKRTIIESVMKGSTPSLENAAEIAKVLGIPLERLLGVEPPPIPEKEKHYEIVPLVEGRLSCGPGALPTDEIKEWLWIPRKHLPGAGHANRYAAIEVSGTSMEPLLLHGETVIVDRTDCDIERLKRESLYAVRVDGHNFVKHLNYNREEQTLYLISYNQDYMRQHGVEHIKLKKGMETPVIGRVVFSFRRWK